MGELQDQSQQEKKELETIVLELQEQLWVFELQLRGDRVRLVAVMGDVDLNLSPNFCFQNQFDSKWHPSPVQKPSQPVAITELVQQTRGHQVVSQVQLCFSVCFLLCSLDDVVGMWRFYMWPVGGSMLGNKVFVRICFFLYSVFKE